MAWEREHVIELAADGVRRYGTTQFIPTIGLMVPVFVIVMLHVALSFGVATLAPLLVLGLAVVVTAHALLIALLRRGPVQKAYEDRHPRPHVHAPLWGLLLLGLLVRLGWYLRPMWARTAGAEALLGAMPSPMRMWQAMVLVTATSYGLMVYEYCLVGGTGRRKAALWAPVGALLFLGTALALVA